MERRIEIELSPEAYELLRSMVVDGVKVPYKPREKLGADESALAELYDRRMLTTEATGFLFFTRYSYVPDRRGESYVKERIAEEESKE